jgi:DNA repair exonuclease SbcCD ATPase subunit
MVKMLVFLNILFHIIFLSQNIQAGIWDCNEEITEASKGLETKYLECKTTISECKGREEKLQTEIRELTDKFHQRDKELTACQSDKGGAAAITAKMDAIQKRELELARWEKELQNQKESLQVMEKAIAEKQEGFFAQQAELMKKVGKTEQLEANNHQLQEDNHKLNAHFWVNFFLFTVLFVTVLILLNMMRKQRDTLHNHIASNVRVIDIIRNTDLIPKEHHDPTEGDSK